ncbi:MAG: Lin0512 family protein [Pseudomonadota bacterium]
MTEQRVILEMGQGADLHGQDMTKAACRAVRDALAGSSLPLFSALGLRADDMRIDVTIGVPDPNAVDAGTVAAQLPYGTVSVRAVPGGLISGDAVLAAASVEVYLPKQTGWRLR